MGAPKGHERYGGRAKGTPNKLSATVKDNVISVFDKLGGVDHMHSWSQSNPSEFYKIYAKLLPIDLQSDGKSIQPVQIIKFGDSAKELEQFYQLKDLQKPDKT